MTYEEYSSEIKKQIVHLLSIIQKREVHHLTVHDEEVLKSMKQEAAAVLDRIFDVQDKLPSLKDDNPVEAVNMVLKLMTEIKR